MKRKEPYQVTIIVIDELATIATVQLTQLPGKGGTEVDSSVNPEVNVQSLAEVFVICADHLAASYYSSHVKMLSKEAREQIKKALDGEDTSPAPF